VTAAAERTFGGRRAPTNARPWHAAQSPAGIVIQSVRFCCEDTAARSAEFCVRGAHRNFEGTMETLTALAKPESALGGATGEN
jgi:hypothetical protein